MTRHDEWLSYFRQGEIDMVDDWFNSLSSSDKYSLSIVLHNLRLDLQQDIKIRYDEDEIALFIQLIKKIDGLLNKK